MQTAFAHNLVNKINKELDLPFVGEAAEAELISLVVTPIAAYIPEAAQDLVLAAVDGLDAEEVESMLDPLASILANEIASRIDIPLLNEATERLVVRKILAAVFVAVNDGLKGDD